MASGPSAGMDASAVERIAAALFKARRVVVVVGAGISVSAGIPDFRSADGLYKIERSRQPDPAQAAPKSAIRGQDLFDAALHRSDPGAARAFLALVSEMKAMTAAAKPTRTHSFLTDLAASSRLMRVYSQNIDGLESRAGLLSALSQPLAALSDKPSQKEAAHFVPLHGDLSAVVCTVCNSVRNLDDEIAAAFSKGTHVACPLCVQGQAARVAQGRRELAVGALRPNVILYNEHHRNGDIISHIQSNDLRRRPDMLIVMGTSLKVVGVKRLVKDFARAVRGSSATRSMSLNGTPSSSNSNFNSGGICVLINATELAAKEWESVFDVRLVAKSDDAVDTIWHRVQHMDDDAAAKRLKRQTERLRRAEKLAASNILPIDGLLKKTKQSSIPQIDTKSLLSSSPKSQRSFSSMSTAQEILSSPGSQLTQASQTTCSTVSTNGSDAGFTIDLYTSSAAVVIESKGRKDAVSSPSKIPIPSPKMPKTTTRRLAKTKSSDKITTSSTITSLSKSIMSNGSSRLASVSSQLTQAQLSISGRRSPSKSSVSKTTKPARSVSPTLVKSTSSSSISSGASSSSSATITTRHRAVAVATNNQSTITQTSLVHFVQPNLKQVSKTTTRSKSGTKTTKKSERIMVPVIDNRVDCSDVADMVTSAQSSPVATRLQKQRAPFPTMTDCHMKDANGPAARSTRDDHDDQKPFFEEVSGDENAVVEIPSSPKSSSQIQQDVGNGTPSKHLARRLRSALHVSDDTVADAPWTRSRSGSAATIVSAGSNTASPFETETNDSLHVVTRSKKNQLKQTVVDDKRMATRSTSRTKPLRDSGAGNCETSNDDSQSKIPTSSARSSALKPQKSASTKLNARRGAGRSG